jgi:branched-chain amino acid transport system permease protein
MSSMSATLVGRVLGPSQHRPKRISIAAAVAVALVLVSVLGNVNLLSVLVNGLQTGVVYALVALGIALVYKSTRVLNFAQGEVGTVAAYIVFMGLARGDKSVILQQGDVSLLRMVAFTLLAIAVGAAISIAINLGIVARLKDGAAVTTLVATIGVALLLSGAQLMYFEALPRSFPQFLAGGPKGFQLGSTCFTQADLDGICQTGDGAVFALGGVNITYQFLLTTAILAIVAAMLAIFFRTPAGVALLATSQEPFAAQLQGVSVRSMSALAWGTAGAFGALAGVLGGGVFQSITPGFMTASFLVPAIVAAVLGGITSMPGAVVGALLLGVAQTLANAVAGANDLSIPGPPQIATFSVLLLVLLIRPRGLFGKEA